MKANLPVDVGTKKAIIACFLPFHHLCPGAWRRTGTHRTSGRGWRARAALWDTVSAEKLLCEHLCYCWERQDTDKKLGPSFILGEPHGDNSNYHEANSNFSFHTVGEKCQAVVLFKSVCIQLTLLTNYWLLMQVVPSFSSFYFLCFQSALSDLFNTAPA